MMAMTQEVGREALPLNSSFLVHESSNSSLIQKFKLQVVARTKSQRILVKADFQMHGRRETTPEIALALDEASCAILRAVPLRRHVLCFLWQKLPFTPLGCF